MTRTIPAALALLFVAVTVAACGGGTAPDGNAKAAIQREATTIIAECGANPDPIRVEQQVDRLLAQADKAGSARFTLGDFHSMNDVLRNLAGFMHRMGCEPDQAQRLRSRAS